MSAPELWERVERVFGQLLDCDPNERPALLAALCGTDRRLREAVEKLLAADTLTGHPLDVDPAAAVAETLRSQAEERWIGKVLSNYKITRLVGRGGMGAVYAARRCDGQFEGEAAIKLLDRGLHDDRGHRRFQTERQILADLDHPGIARLLDGGTTPEGTPYLVMEFVNGESVTDYCDANTLSIRARLHLILEIGSAVQHAHQRLVIHRDIKASNILVTADGQSKLLDFGIAKLLAEDELQQPTEALFRAATPGYASPEQLMGRPMTVGSDVYSLGVLLYELLAGRRPLDLDTGDLVALGQLLETAEPPRVSSWFSSAQPEDERVARARRLGVSAGRAQRILSGDLDTVLNKALMKTVGERYASVELMLADVRRHLAGLPVRARRPRWSYRASKFLRRNAAAVALSALVILALLSFSVATYEQRNRARREKGRAEAVTRFLVETYNEIDPANSRGQAVTALEVANRSAARLDAELVDQPALRARLQQTLGEVYEALGELQTARGLIVSALAAESARLGADDPSLATLYRLMGGLELELGSYEEALGLAQRAIAVSVDGSVERSRGLRLLGLAKFAQGHREEAIGVLEQVLTMQSRLLAPSDPLRIETLKTVASRFEAVDQNERASELLGQALTLQQRHHPGDQPTTARILEALASLNRRQPERLAAARDLAEQALDMNLRLYGEANRRRIEVFNTLANIEGRLGRYAAAVDRYRQAIAVSAETIGADNPRVAGLHLNLGTVLSKRLGRPAEAEPELRRAIEIYDGVRKKNPEHPNVAFLLMALGEVLTDLDQLAEAETTLLEALRIWTVREEAGDENGCLARTLLARVRLRIGSGDDVEHHLVDCYPVLRDEAGATDHGTRLALEALVEHYTRAGDTQRAREYSELLAASGHAGLESDRGSRVPS